MMVTLSVNLNCRFMLDCEMFSRLAFILTRPENDIWYKERFFTCMLVNNYAIQISKQERYYDFSDYDEVLNIESVNISEYNPEIIIEAIDSSKYVRAIIDRYYLPNSSDYRVNHIIHDVNIYGYDSDEKQFIFFEHQVNNQQWGSGKISFDEFKDALAGGLDSLSSNNDFVERELYYNPVYFLTVKGVARKKPCIELLYYDINKWLRGQIVTKEITTEGKLSKTSFTYGLSIYKCIYNDINTKFINGDYENLNSFVYFFRNFLSVKEFLVDKLEFYNLKTNIAFPQEYIERSRDLSIDIKKVFALFTRFSLLKEPKVINTINEMMQKAEIKDYELLIDLKNHIRNNSKSELERIVI